MRRASFRRSDDTDFSPVVAQWQLLLQLVVAYAAAVMWFKDGIYGAWHDTLEHDYLGMGQWFEARGIQPTPANSMQANERHLGILAASGWHMMLTMFGFVVGNTLKRLQLKQGVALGIAFIASVLTALYYATRYGFDNGLWGVHSVAAALRWPTHIPDSSHYLGLCGAVSQSVWLAAAMALSSCDEREVGYCPEIVAKYLNRLVIFYGMTFAFFRFATVPFWSLTVRYSILAPEIAVPVDPSGQPRKVENMAYLASATHTLTIILGVVCARLTHALLRFVNPQRFNSNTNQCIVLVLLCLSFSVAFSRWVTYSLQQPVDHVVRFAEAFVGADAVRMAAKQQWSGVHTLMLSSYATWFSCGVVFEQCWGGSASNAAVRRDPGGLSAALLAFVVSLIVLPIAWLGGYVGFVAMVILLWPAKTARRPRRPQTPPDAYKRVSWAQATSDCPRTGHQYLVIGVGFVGVSLVKRLLERGETRIRAFDISPRNPFEGDSRVHYIRGNVMKTADLAAACEGVDTVYATFAAIRFFERMDFQAALSINVNIKGTENVLKVCRDVGVKRFIQTSTSNVMATPKLNKLNMAEDSPYVTRDISHNHYSWTKAEAEKLVLAANSDRMATVAVRPCSGVFGATDRTLVERFLRHKVLVMPEPTAKIDYVFCENVVLGHLKAEARLLEGRPGVAGEAFNISNEEPVSYEEFSIAVQHYYGPGLYRVPSPWFLLRGLCYVVEAFQWLTRSRISLGADLDITTPPCLTTAGMTFTVASEKARRVLNYRPCWTFDEAIQQSLVDFADLHGSQQKHSKSD